MSLLMIIWLAALGLMVFSLTAMMTLIAARLARERDRNKRAARRAVILPELVNHIGGLNEGPLNLFGLEGDAKLMASVVRDLAGLVRGSERNRLMGQLQALKVDRTLRNLLHHGSVNQRILAAEALIFFPDEITRLALIDAGRHAPARVRQAALRALIDIGAAPPLSELLDSVITGSDRASLLFSDLLQRATKTQIEDAIDALKRTDLPRSVRLMLLTALGSTRDIRALAPLQQAAQADDAEIRAGAFASLSALGHPDARTIVVAGLQDHDWRVRLKAIECVRKLGLTEFIPALRICAQDEVWWVRYRAGEALIAIAEQDVVKLKDILTQAVQATAAPITKPKKKRTPAKPRAVKEEPSEKSKTKRKAPAKPKTVAKPKAPAAKKSAKEKAAEPAPKKPAKRVLKASAAAPAPKRARSKRA